jgi:hypothetical protein
MEDATAAVVWGILRVLRGASVDLCRSRIGGRIQGGEYRETNFFEFLFFWRDVGELSG